MDCNHKWIVYSTAVSVGCLMLVCANCGVYGTIADPTEDEWSVAFYAPDTPYEWSGGDERVVLD